MIDDFTSAVGIMCNHAQASIMKATQNQFDTVWNGVRWIVWMRAPMWILSLFFPIHAPLSC